MGTCSIYPCMTLYSTLPQTNAWVTEFCWHELYKLCCLETSCHGYRFWEEQLNVMVTYLLNSRSVKKFQTDGIVSYTLYIIA
jgi:hypothetical protein